MLYSVQGDVNRFLSCETKGQKMYHIKNDQRAIRSSKMLYEALAQLIRERPYNTITVTHLVEAAQLGRATFYRNFDEIEDILRMRCDQVFEELIAYFIAYRQEDRTNQPGRLLKPLLRYFYLNSDIIDLLLRANRIDILLDSFRERSQGIQAQVAKQLQITDEYMAYSVEIRINLMLAIVTHWVRTGKREAPDELADNLKTMIGNMASIDQLL